MDKITYLAELAEGLARWVPERERQDILRYYAEYFEEAGPDREGEVVAELGDPWALSCRLAVEGGYVSSEQAASWRPKRKKRWPWLLAAAVAVLVFVVGPVAWAASQIGRTIGQVVYSSGVVDIVASVEEALPGTDFGVTYVYQEKDSAGGFWSMEDGCLEAFTEIDIDVSLANVTVTGGEDYTLFIDADTTLGGYGLKWEVKNGVLKLRDDGGLERMDITSWEDFKKVFGINASAMDVTITVPDGVPLNKLKAKIGLGDVFLSQLYVEKELEAETGLGDVEYYEVRAMDEVDLESGLGDVTLAITEPYSGAEFSAKTGMGTVEVNVESYEKDWDYEAKTGMGTVTVNGDSRGTKVERKGTGDYKLEAKSGKGDINLYFQDDRW